MLGKVRRVLAIIPFEVHGTAYQTAILFAIRTYGSQGRASRCPMTFAFSCHHRQVCLTEGLKLREAEIVDIPFWGALAGCSARRSERRVASHTSEEQRRNAPARAAKNGILAFFASLRPFPRSWWPGRPPPCHGLCGHAHVPGWEGVETREQRRGSRCCLKPASKANSRAWCAGRLMWIRRRFRAWFARQCYLFNSYMRTYLLGYKLISLKL